MSVLLDGRWNSVERVVANLVHISALAAVKLHAGIRDFASQPVCSSWLEGACGRLVDVLVLAVGARRRKRWPACEGGIEGNCSCAVGAGEVRWIGLCAIDHVLRRKQTKYHQVLTSLERQRAEVWAQFRRERAAILCGGLELAWDEWQHCSVLY